MSFFRSRVTNAFGVLMMMSLFFVAGCEWEGSGDGDFWSSRYDYLDFSGVYRVPGGGPIVVTYESASAGDQEREIIGSGNGFATTFVGVLDYRPVPGTLTISAGGFHLVDDGSGGLAGNNVAGTINYNTGAWSLDLLGAPLNNGEEIVASYRYSGEGVVEPGSTHAIYQFTVQQTGNQVKLIDNHNDAYTGKLTSSDVMSETPVENGERRIAQRFSFVAEGTSRGIEVSIVGSFRVHQTEYYRMREEAGDDGLTREPHHFATVSSYFLEGSWVESSGITARIDCVGPADRRIDTFEFD